APGRRGRGPLARGAALGRSTDAGAGAGVWRRETAGGWGWGGAPRFSGRVARKRGRALPPPPFSLAFLDPPYGRGLAEAALASARAGGWLTPAALIVVEEAASAAFAAPEGFDELERRRYDDTALIVLRHCG